METEIEVKFTDVDPKKIRGKLNKLGAKLIHEEFVMKREALDFPDDKLNEVGAWARVRTEADKITLSYKQVNDRTLHGTKEISVEVDSFEKASELLKCLGLIVKSYQETKREKWVLNDCEVTIDTWPWIPSFVEIEGPSEKLVKKTADDLDFDWSRAMHGSVETVYQQHFDVTEFEVNHWPEIKFGQIPENIEAKKLKK